MRALQAVREAKRCVSFGAWVTGKMPNKAFPLSKGHNYRLGSGWRWSVFELEAGSKRYRLLVAYEYQKAQYLAWLGLCDGND